ncbi:hypothetical protein EMIT0111MI5_60213 [Burkholderia sp. IT-111MI5]
MVPLQRVRTPSARAPLRAARRADVVLLPPRQALGRATGWHGLAQFQAAVSAARAKIAAASRESAGGDPAAGDPAAGDPVARGD